MHPLAPRALIGWVRARRKNTQNPKGGKARKAKKAGSCSEAGLLFLKQRKPSSQNVAPDWNPGGFSSGEQPEAVPRAATELTQPLGKEPPSLTWARRKGEGLNPHGTMII